MFRRCLKYVVMICAVAVWSADVAAQFLPTANNGFPLKKEVKPANSVQNLNVPHSAPVSAAQAAVAEKRLQNKNPSPFDYSKIDVEDAPKKDIVSIRDKDGKKLNNEVILIYMKNFNVYRTASRQVRCSVRFALVSTFKEKISNVSYELKWPKMSTRFSFSDIEPQREYYIDYLLLGDGCYTMDKTPNVIVNRCRVKNITQEACAASLRWMKFGM